MSQSNPQAIRNLQTYLRQISYDRPGRTAPPIDGVFDDVTLRALQEFQRDEGLPISNAADAVAWQRLYDAYLLSIAENRAPLSVVILPRSPDNDLLRIGSLGFPVSAIQYMLRELALKHGVLDPVEPTGFYDDTTARAVREFQVRNNLPVTGEVDRMTWNEITSQYNVRARDYSEE